MCCQLSKLQLLVDQCFVGPKHLPVPHVALCGVRTFSKMSGTRTITLLFLKQSVKYFYLHATCRANIFPLPSDGPFASSSRLKRGNREFTSPLSHSVAQTLTLPLPELVPYILCSVLLHPCLHSILHCSTTMTRTKRIKTSTAHAEK
jgi:hypothetical protein